MARVLRQSSTASRRRGLCTCAQARTCGFALVRGCAVGHMCRCIRASVHSRDSASLIVG